MGLTTRQKSGIDLEDPTACYFEEKKLIVEKNSFEESKYPTENKLAVDVCAYTNKQKAKGIIVECTNEKKSTFMNDKIMMEKLNHFLERDPKHKFEWALVCTFENWNKKIKTWLIEHNVLVEALGFRVNKRNKTRTIKALGRSKLNTLIKRLRMPKFPQTALKFNKKGKLAVSKREICEKCHSFFSVYTVCKCGKCVRSYSISKSIDNSNTYNTSNSNINSNITLTNTNTKNTLCPHEQQPLNSVDKDILGIIWHNLELLRNGYNIFT
jgi:hypothetical protein